jgi:hypothetical protein
MLEDVAVLPSGKVISEELGLQSESDKKGDRREQLRLR